MGAVDVAADQACRAAPAILVSVSPFTSEACQLQFAAADAFLRGGQVNLSDGALEATRDPSAIPCLLQLPALQPRSLAARL